MNQSQHAGMDHSQHTAGMDHSQHHAGMDHSSTNHTMSNQSSHSGHHMHHDGGTGMGGGHEGHDMSGGHSMTGMFFEWRVTEDAVLFKFWEIRHSSSLATSLFIIFLLGIFKEFLACWRRKRHQMRRQEEARQHYGRWHSIAHRVIDAGLYMTQVTVSYFLMLIAMTYNIALFMAVMLGLGFGYLLFLSGPDHGYGQQTEDSVKKSNGDGSEINGVVHCRAIGASPTSVLDVEDCCD